MKSMTGFAEVKKDFEGYSIKGVIKSVNGKYLDCQVKGNEFSSPFEGDILNVIKKSVGRGRVTVWTDIFIDNSDLLNVSINLTTINPVLKELKNIKKDFPDFDYSVPISSFLSGSNYVNVSIDQNFAQKLKNNVLEVIETLVVNFNKMRRAEGEVLKKDILERVEKIKISLNEIEKLREDFLNNNLIQYKEKIRKLIDTGEIDETRIAMEAGILVDKLDISEEITRLNSHINVFLENIENEESNGKKLDFIIQEMFRETNTIGSKGKNKNIAIFVVEIKTELEKIREQVQNLE